MKKRNIMLGSSVLLAVLLVVGGTMAWFTAEADPITNNFKAGTVDIKINDTFDATKAQNVNPGDTYSKVVNIENIGSKKAYIRVKLTPEFTADPELELEEALDTAVATYPILNGWILNDGWYYYPNIVEKETNTANIIEEVKFAGAEMDNDYQGAGFTLKVEAEAIQATNGAINDAWTVDPAILGLEVLP